MFAYMGRKGEKGAWGVGQGLKTGQLTLSMGPARVEVCIFV
jgi:hypothetical protein